jgi:hypothetical protein
MRKKAKKKAKITPEIEKLSYCKNVYFDGLDECYHCNVRVPMNCSKEALQECPTVEARCYRFGLDNIIMEL